MAVNIKHPARARIWKRISIIGACITSLAIIIIIIISLLQRGSDAFSIRIDNPTEETPFHIAQFGYNNEDEHGNPIKPEDAELEDSGVYVKGEAVDNMEPTFASNVLKYLREYPENNDGKQLSGSNNFIDEDGIGRALVYTVYLVNDTKDPIEDLKYAVKLEGTSDASYHYLRILCQTQLIHEDDTEDDMNNAFYGETYVNTYDSAYGEISTPFKDKVGYQEPVSNRRIKTKDGNKRLEAAAGFGDGDPENENNYCINFQNLDDPESTDSKSYEIVNQKIQTINSGEKLRFTFVAYFEGNDVHCQGQAPKDSFILLSLHFGQ